MGVRVCASVTTCGRATTALALLREKKGAFDLVMSDVYMPDMDGFKLLELIGLEMDIPLISKLCATDPAGKRFRYVCFSLEH